MLRESIVYFLNWFRSSLSPSFGHLAYKQQFASFILRPRATKARAFTLFPFNHEPFGYVLLESMACGTPVLTYDIQGPAEYVIDQQTGWLAQSDINMVAKVVQLWDESYGPLVRRNCTSAASKLDKEVCLGRWMKSLNII